MCDDLKKLRSDALWKTGQDATERFEKRRSSEWKLLISFWTPLMVASGYLVTNKTSISCPSATATTVLVIVLAYIFSKWRLYIHDRNTEERKKAIYWKNLYLRTCGAEPPSGYYEKLYPGSVRMKKDSGGYEVLGLHDGFKWEKDSPWGYDSVRAHLAITWLLVAGFLFFILEKAL